MRTKRKLYLNACKRCQGDLFPDEPFEEYSCLQCGGRFTSREVKARHRSAELAKAA